MKKLIFLISVAILSANISLTKGVLYADEYSYSAIKSLTKNESLYSGYVLTASNYAYVVNNLHLYDNPTKSRSNFYTLYHNNNLVDSYGEVAYYNLYADGSIISIGRRDHIIRAMWFIRSSKLENELVVGAIDFIDESADRSRTLTFTRLEGIGRVLDIKDGNITEIAKYTAFIDSVVSTDGQRFAFSIQKDDGLYYLVENMTANGELTEHIMGEEGVSSLILAENGSRLVYKKFDGIAYYLIDGDNTIGPFKEINNIAISRNGNFLAYSYKNLAITNTIQEIVETRVTLTNIVITTNYHGQEPQSTDNANANTSQAGSSTTDTNTSSTTVATNTNRSNTQRSSIVTNYYTNSNNSTSSNQGYINYLTDEADEQSGYSSAKEILQLDNKKPITVEYLYKNMLSIILAQQAVATHEYDLGYTVTTNEVVITTNIVEVIEKEIILEQYGETLMLNSEFVATYDEITNVGFSPNSSSFLYFNKKDSLTYITDDGNKSDGYTNITAYQYSDDGKVFSYSADSKLFVNSDLREVGVVISGIHYLSDDSILYKKSIFGRYIMEMYDYESAAYDEIVSIDFIKSNRENTIARNSFVFVGKRGSKYYCVDRKKIAHGPYQYISPTIKDQRIFYSIASDDKNIFLLSY